MTGALSVACIIAVTILGTHAETIRLWDLHGMAKDSGAASGTAVIRPEPSIARAGDVIAVSQPTDTAGSTLRTAGSPSSNACEVILPGPVVRSNRVIVQTDSPATHAFRSGKGEAMLAFMHCALPPQEYIATHAQTRKATNAPWVPVITTTQCFRTRVDPELKAILFRKDNIQADYYGEIFTYDDSGLIRLHSETFPAPTPVDFAGASWDDRPDRFRIFVDRSGGDWRLGRIMAPLNASLTWSYAGRLDTYICTNWPSYHNQTARKWQDNFRDNAVFLERYGPFSTTSDGRCPPGYEPDPEFTSFDEVIVINQCMENDAGRERFYFARRGSMHYGIVRWDFSSRRNGDWFVSDRTIGLRRGTQNPVFSFAGMETRVREYLKLTNKVSAGN